MMTIQPRMLINLPPTFFTHPLLDAHWERLRQLATIRQTSHDTLDQLMPDLIPSDAVLMWSWPKIGAAELQRAADLRFVGQLNTSRTTAQACLERGVAHSEARHCWSPAVAEMALALILSGLRKLSDYHAAMRAGTEAWVERLPGDIDPLERELTGAAIGIVGFGRIGQRLAELLAPFQTDLRIYDPFLPAVVAQQHNAQPVDLPELIGQSDVVVVCAANTPEAQHLLDRELIMALRPNAVFVNVGRSMLIDMPALIERLQRGDLLALLDVFDREPLEADSPLRRLPNAYLTPHRAGGLLASVQRGLTMLIDDYEAFLAGRPRRFAVTEAMLNSFSDA
jgi:D-3-phosphoglycerate dehydrogenase / 2-oxoglutarate reductase